MKGIVAVVVMAGLAVSCFAGIGRSEAETQDTHVIAIVLEKKITANEKDKLSGLIFSALLQQYARDKKIEPTEEELDTFVRRMQEIEKQQQVQLEARKEKLQRELRSSSISDRERKGKESELQTIESLLKSNLLEKEKTEGMEDQARHAMRQVAHEVITSWKVNKALYEKYGGRLIFQQAGAEPFDAYREFLKEQEKKGTFQIIDKNYEASFWRYFTNEAMHTFFNKDEGLKFIKTPWWMMELPPGE